ncbi:MAG: hypothetical protein LBR16_01435 [Treponema sp.]|jgi:hypothetical protein|nr:hypothetical protein [Treponema sp.]
MGFSITNAARGAGKFFRERGRRVEKRLRPLADKLFPWAAAERRVLVMVLAGVPGLCALFAGGVLIGGALAARNGDARQVEQAPGEGAPMRMLFVPDEPDFAAPVLLPREGAGSFGAAEADALWTDPAGWRDENWQGRLRREVDTLLREVR